MERLRVRCDIHAATLEKSFPFSKLDRPVARGKLISTGIQGKVFAGGNVDADCLGDIFQDEGRKELGAGELFQVVWVSVIVDSIERRWAKECLERWLMNS